MGRGQQMDTKELYWQWLNGKSLRAVGSTAGLSYARTVRLFRSTFGEGATNPEAMSFIRSILEDYEAVTRGDVIFQPDGTWKKKKGRKIANKDLIVHPDILKAWVFSLIEQGHRSDYKYRSNHSLNMLSKYHTVDENKVSLEVAGGIDPTSDPWDYLEDDEQQVS